MNLKKYLANYRLSQVVLEYAILFAVVTAALVASSFLVNAHHGFYQAFHKMANVMAGNSLTWK